MWSIKAHLTFLEATVVDVVVVVVVLVVTLFVVTDHFTRLGSSVSNSTFRLKVLVLVFKLYVEKISQN